MKIIACLAAVGMMTLPSSLLSTKSDVADTHRFLIVEHGKYGFINSSGKVAIEPAFEAAQKFSEGLAAVRVDGRYGFIDAYGEIVIAPAYDYAVEFSEGLAMVYNEGKVIGIDRSGNIVFKTPFTAASNFTNDRALVLTGSGRMGCIDKSGSLVIDTIYNVIYGFKDGLTVARQYSDNDPLETKVCILNESGEVVVPFGRYSDIRGPFDGRFCVEIPGKRGKGPTDAVLDSRGWITYPLSPKYTWFDQRISDDIMIAAPSRKLRKSEYAFMNFKGQLVYDRDVELAVDFHENFGFYRGKDGRYSLIDRNGKVIAHNVYDDVVRPGFVGGRALVEEDGQWGIIDTTGAYILRPQLTSVYSLMQGYVVTQDESDTVNYLPKYGLVDLQGTTIIPPVLQQLDLDGFVDGLLSTWMDNRLTYFDAKGNIVWQQSTEDDEDLRALNIDFMKRGYFYVSGVNTGHSIVGHGTSAQKVTMQNSFQGAALSVLADVDIALKHARNTKGVAVYVANTTGDTIRFNAQDGRLYMKMQAFDPTGAWRDIEYLPSSWCGNSYHSLVLAPNEYWLFAAPVYEGSFNTKLRIELKYVDPEVIKTEGGLSLERSYGDEKELVIYSNTFDGSINLAQFWRKAGYSASGIMDPYNE